MPSSGRYFPMQKSLNMTSSISSTPTLPVIRPSCLIEARSSSAERSSVESKSSGISVNSRQNYF